MKRRIFLLFSLGMLMLGAPREVFAWDGAFFDLFQVPFTAREAALGGNHAAQADDVSTLVSNVAGFRSAGPDLLIGGVNVSYYGQPSNPGITNSTFDLFGPLSMAYVGNGLGFGVFSDINVTASTTAYYPSVVTQNLVIITGYAFRIPLADPQSTLDVGFSFPIFLAARSFSSQDIRSLLSSSVTPFQFVVNEQFALAAGISAEFGVLYSLNNTFSVGLAARNLAITSASYYAKLSSYQDGASPYKTVPTPIPMDVSLGIRWNPPVKMSIPSIDGFSIMADYNDIFDFLIYPPGARNPLLHIGLGTEITLLKIVKLRAGFYQLLPSGGLSLDLSVVALDIAVFGREKSPQPWTDYVYGFMAGLRVKG
jgi:hypothetical protein